ncbi:toll-like receptor 6 [Centruroides sculpturatus]|uniref:toll-like receptor 6 n=1 Tax=Centruroides sculpturatus TaxID=218467 RepID=UPI000C6D2336|nr:toll-like receptor 6 [Centruroides sculpturatus]XP_023214737.1 toll-like receptor 6 [Centruroides sculpturatus]
MNLLWMILTLVNLYVTFINCNCPVNCVCPFNDLIKSVTCTHSIPKKLPFNTTELLVTRGRKLILQSEDTRKLGQLEKFQLIHLFIENITDGTFQVNNFLHLSTLRLSYNNIRQITSKTFEGLENLKELYLDNNNMRFITIDAFITLRSLKILHLQRNYLEEIPKPLPNKLETLELNDNNIESITLLNENLSFLKELNLCGNKYKSILNKDIDKLYNLQTVCLGDEVSNVYPQVFALMPQLKALKITGKKNPTPQTFQGFPFLTQLETLSINYLPITIFDVNFGAWKNLKYFYFNNIKTLVYINKNVFESFAKNIELADLSGSTMFVNSLFSKDLLKYLINVKTLNLANTGITTIPDLKMKWLPNLQQLDISNNPLMCDCNVQWLADAKKQYNLEIDYYSETKCAKPNSLSGKIFFDKEVQQTICVVDDKKNETNEETYISDKLKTEKSHQETKINVLVSFVILLAILVIVLIVIVIILLIKYKHPNNHFLSERK